MRIALVHAYAGLYSLGTDNYVRYLAKELAKLKQDVYLITGGKRTTTFLKDVKVISAPFIDVMHSLQSKSKIPFGFNAAKSIFNMLESSSILLSSFLRLLKKFDIVGTHYVPETIAAAYARRLTGTPVVFTAHGFSLGECRAVRLADAVISVSESVGAAYKQSTGIDCYMISSGIDTDIFRPLPNSAIIKPTILTVARLDPIKGIEYLLRSISLLKKFYPSIRCLIVGPGHLNYYKLLSKQLGIGENVFFVGAVEHEMLPIYYSMADAVVVPSLYEGFGLVVLEAMACGKTIVATTTGNIPYLIRDGVNGLLIPPKDEKAIAESLLKILSDDELKRKLENNARKTVLKYSWEKTAREVLKVYLETISASRKVS